MVNRTQRTRFAKRCTARTKKAMTGGFFGFHGKSQRSLEERKPGNQKMFDVLVSKLGNQNMTDVLVNNLRAKNTLSFIGGGNDKNSILPISATLNTATNGNKYLKLQEDIYAQLGTIYYSIINNHTANTKNNINTNHDMCGVCVSIGNIVGVLPLSLLTMKDNVYYNLPLEFALYNSQTPINREYIKSQNEGSRRLGGQGGNPKFLYVIGLKPQKTE